MFLEIMQWMTGIFVVVYDGQHALKFNLGRAREVVGPGVHFKWPVIQKFQVEDTRHTTLDLEPQVIQLQDDLVYEVDAKVIYQITDLRKALIEIDDVVQGLQNVVVMAIQQVIQAQNRESIRETPRMTREIEETLRTAQDQWGLSILKIGFSNISPSPASLEITQLELLARERLMHFKQMRGDSMSEEAAVALVTGAVVATHAAEPVVSGRHDAALLAERVEALADEKAEDELGDIIGDDETDGAPDEGPAPDDA